jgi:hypothetical protein
LVPTLGVEGFVDSYLHPERYRYEDGRGVGLASGASYVVVKDAEPSTVLLEGDLVVFRGAEGVSSGTIVAVATHEGATTYMARAAEGIVLIEGSSILGKVTGVLRTTLWTSLCLQLWQVSTHGLDLGSVV